MRILISLILGLFITTSVNAADFKLKSTAFSDKSIIPNLYSCDGKDISPDLTWVNTPVNTQSFAITLSSLDWSTQPIFLWIVYNIPNTTTKLPQDVGENLPDGALSGMNYYNDTTYHGPCPPDSVSHHYVFTVYALDTILDAPAGMRGDAFLDTIQNHILTKAELTGLFKH